MLQADTDLISSKNRVSNNNKKILCFVLKNLVFTTFAAKISPLPSYKSSKVKEKICCLLVLAKVQVLGQTKVHATHRIVYGEETLNIERDRHINQVKYISEFSLSAVKHIELMKPEQNHRSTTKLVTYRCSSASASASAGRLRLLLLVGVGSGVLIDGPERFRFYSGENQYLLP